MDPPLATEKRKKTLFCSPSSHPFFFVFIFPAQLIN